MSEAKPLPQVSELRWRGDRAYLDFHEQCKRTECLGADAKMQAGKFGREELTAHMIAQELLGKHKAYHDAASYLAASPQEPSRGEIEAGVWEQAADWVVSGDMNDPNYSIRTTFHEAFKKKAAAARGGK